MTDFRREIGDRVFRNPADYSRGLKDLKVIDDIKTKYKDANEKELLKLLDDLKSGKYHFETLLGDDFMEEIEERILHPEIEKAKKNIVLDPYAKEKIKKDDIKRKVFLSFLIALSVICFGYLFFYSYSAKNKDLEYASYVELKNKALDDGILKNPAQDSFQINYTDDENKELIILDEYKNLYNKNKKLIGWLNIADINDGNVFMDLPVMQTSDNEYYLTHDMNQKTDKNGTIFMDKDCDVVKPSTNYILYGHHMSSGKMFGNLSKYESEEFYKSHPIINFDTIYEKGQYEVMYVFRSKVYKETEITFKYYQFIDANSEMEFDSYMEEMAEISFYDTGVNASFGDHLLTLSTCDYEEKDGRFVVVAKKIE